MANPGAGAKFLSVNLNKSYGQSGHSSSSSSSYASGRGRPGGYSAGGAGMVVLSRPRSSHKAAPKLSVPPPVNLPSLRKEHERFDPLGSGSGSAAGIGPGNGTRPVSSAMGWSKASAVAQVVRDGIDNARPPSSESWDHRQQFAEGLRSSIPPPAASLGKTGSSLSIPVQPEKITVLRGEDFPSLSATISSTSGPSHKQKNGLHNQKLEMIEESSSVARDGSRLSSSIDMRPLGHSSQSSHHDGISANRGDNPFSGVARLSEQARKQDSHLSGQLPLVRLSPRSDWADDERDTSHAFSERSRDMGFSKMEPYWDKDFDFPRSNIVPHKPAQNILDRWTRHDDNKGYGLGGRQQFQNSVESSNGRAAEWNMRERSRNGPESNRQKVESVLSSSVSNPSTTSGSKGLSGSDSLLNFGRGKQNFSRGEKPSVEDWGNTSFDESDPFSGTLLGIVKRKKDTSKQVDFHDPVRESFEAELERVQKLQEQERQRIVEEQERALEMAREEEEDRQRMLREQEEHQRQMEEEVREAAWRAEQERLEAIRKAEEQKMVREEEKRRMLMEEERRKQAANQKLLELEQKIARRQAEAVKVDGSAAVVDEGVSRVPVERVDEPSSWEDSERAVERLRNSVPADSSSLRRSFDAGSRVHNFRDGPFAFTDRGKSNSWRRDAFENGNSSSLFPPEQVNGYQIPRSDAFASGRSFPRYNANGYMASRNYYGGGFPESQLDDSEFHETGTDRFNDIVLNQGNSRGNLHAPYGDRVHQNSELDELYSYGRTRYSSRQPRVLPPPLASMHRTSFGSDAHHVGASTYGDSSTQYNHTSRSELSVSMYDNDQREMQEDADILDLQEDSGKTEVQSLNQNNAIGCDSQSSLSVSSPPHSPAHLSHDDLDDTGDSLVASAPAPAEGNEIPLSGNDPIVLDTKIGKEKMMTALSCMSTGDDDEWAIESNAELQEQKDYDEDEDGYHEEDEENERDNENVDLALEFEGMHLDGKDSSAMENMVLGFDQGVEVGIPSDEYERSPRNEENSYLVKQVSANESFGDKQEDALSKQYGGASAHTVDNCSPGVVQEAQPTIHDMVTQPINDFRTSAYPDLSNDSNSSDLSSGTAISGCQPVPVHSSANVNSFSSGPAVISTAASASASLQNQAEMPVKLQFGLFSGPSLIPSPIPAIQIGSIQMPLQLPHQVGSSLTHMHPPQPTLFQFGQIRYPSPISHGLLQLTPQSMTCSQPNVQANYPLNKKPGVPPSAQPSQDGFAHSFIKDYTFPLIVESQHHDAPKSSASQMVSSKEASLVKGSRNKENDAQLLHQSPAQGSSSGMNRPRVESNGQSESKASHHNAGTNIASTSTGPTSEGELQNGSSSIQSLSSVANLSRTAVHGQASGSRGRKVPFTARSHTQKLPSTAGDASHSHATGFQKRPHRGVQRMEFRVRQNTDRRQSYGSLTHQPITDMKSNNNGKISGTFTRSGLQKETPLDRMRQAAESVNLGNDQGVSQGTNHQMKADKGNWKEAPMNQLGTSHQAEGRLKRHISSEEDVDAPLQSGIVRIFNQPGIEAPSDEDDFIEVRSKRQMLNDRREQREKEKAKSKNKKAMRKPRSATQGIAVARTKSSTSSIREAPKSFHADVTQNRGLINQEVVTGSNIVSQSLAPIGPPLVNPEAPAGSNSHSRMDKTAQTSSTLQAVSSSGQTGGQGLNFESEKKLLDNIQTSLGSWDNAQINQEVMPLTQTQFDEAMKPGRVDMHSSSVEDHIKSVSEIGRSTSPIIMKDTPYSSATSPIKSLLAGEKIQFGAVTSPAVLPPSNRAVAHGIVPPGSEKIQFGAVTSPAVPPSSRSVPHGIGPPVSEKIQFGALPSPTVLPHSSSAVPHEKHLEDCEAEAEAAASAIAVAAISNDEGVRTCPGSMSDAKGFGNADMDGLATSGVAYDQPTGESKAEEALTVSLPADLSVETPPISLWPPLPSPHSSSSHILSPFPGGAPSPFPYYDMNPMLGGPVFAFGPHEEFAGSQSQSQPQKSSVSSDSGPLGTWQPCHSGVDSFYGPPAGFPGPFINPPGSIPGVQAPPHMVVYNHFAPVGRFGQVGLSYMGTYISSTKQPDWKHNPSPNSSTADGDIKNLNMVSAQHNPPGVPQPQHLAPGSALLPMASPSVAMFDISPFQSSAELPVQACWSHVPAQPSLQPVPHSMSLQQRPEDVMPPQLRLMPTDNHSLRSSRFVTPQTQPGNVVEAVVIDPTKPQPQKFGLVDPQNSNLPLEASVHGSSNNSISNPNAVSCPSRPDPNKPNMQNTSSGLKVQPSEQHSSGQRQHNHRPGYSYQRGGGGGSHKSGSGAEWSGRRTGFHGRNNQSGNGGRGFPPTKMKQIYVAKQSSGSGASTIQ